MDELRRHSAPAFAPTGWGTQGMTTIMFFAFQFIWSITIGGKYIRRVNVRKPDILNIALVFLIFASIITT